MGGISGFTGVLASEAAIALLGARGFILEAISALTALEAVATAMTEETMAMTEETMAVAEETMAVAEETMAVAEETMAANQRLLLLPSYAL